MSSKRLYDVEFHRFNGEDPPEEIGDVVTLSLAGSNEFKALHKAIADFEAAGGACDPFGHLVISISIGQTPRLDLEGGDY